MTAADEEFDYDYVHNGTHYQYNLPDDEEEVPTRVAEADEDCPECGGTGRVIRSVPEREGFVPCPTCRPEGVQ